MKKLCIWLCIISGLISWETLQAQEVEVLSQDTLSIKKKFRKHPMTLRAGLDLYRPIRTQIDDEYSSFELVTDLNITDNLYIALEAGTEERTMQSEQVNFDVKETISKSGSITICLKTGRAWTTKSISVFESQAALMN